MLYPYTQTYCSRPELPMSASTLDVVVLDAAQRSALAAVRSLGKRGLRVAVADSIPDTAAGRSRYCRRHFTYPDPEKRPTDFIEWLHELGRLHPGIVVLPVTDLSVPLTIDAIASNAWIRSPLPPRASYESAIDKFECARLGELMGLRAPRTHLISVRDPGALDTLNLSFPVVLKPRRSVARTDHGTFRLGVTYATSVADLRAKVAALAEIADDVLLQEKIVGTGAGVFALYANGSPCGFFAHRRLREKPPSGGVSVLSESATPDTATQHAVERLLTSLSWHGVAMVELKIAEDGSAWLMEVNARLWGSLQLAIDCGIDFPFYLFQLATGQAVSFPQAYPSRRLRSELGDLDNLYLTMRDESYSLRSKAVALARFCVPWRPGMRYELTRFDDLGPAWFAIRTYVRELLNSRPR